MSTGAFVSWVPACGRSQGFIDALGLTPIYSSYLRPSDLVSAPLKYGPQFVDTLRRLHQHRPDLVFVMNPPVFAVAAVAIYAARTGAKYVMDSHSGAFESRKWRWTLPLQRWFCRRAAAVMVTNPVHQEMVDSWGARAMIVADPPPTFPLPTLPQRGRDEVSVFVIATYSPDEAIPEVIEAARALPHVRFRISGNIARAPRGIVERRPPNVELTGFVPMDTFWHYVQTASAILTLTHQENTILRGGWEAMFAGRPLITSDTAALRGYFVEGTRFVDNTILGIKAGIVDVLENQAEYLAGMERLRDSKRSVWERQQAELQMTTKTAMAQALVG
jgi:glycosyltransferase involved in cell wall biosynthesis